MTEESKPRWDPYYPVGRGGPPGELYALVLEEQRYDPLVGLTVPITKRAFPISDPGHARMALKVCAQAEYYEKAKECSVFPDREQRHHIRKMIWQVWQIKPIYYEKETEIELTLDDAEPT